MNWKFWNWDWTGSKRVKRLEERIKELEKEVGIRDGDDSMYSAMSRMISFWAGTSRDGKPIRLHDKVARIQRFLNISIERGPCEIVTKKIKPSRR